MNTTEKKERMSDDEEQKEASNRSRKSIQQGHERENNPSNTMNNRKYDR